MLLLVGLPAPRTSLFFLAPRPVENNHREKKDTSAHVPHVDLDDDDLEEVDPLSSFCKKFVTPGTCKSLVGLTLGEKIARSSKTFAEVCPLLRFHSTSIVFCWLYLEFLLCLDASLVCCFLTWLPPPTAP